MSNQDEDDVKLTLLHTADWHLGQPYRSFDGDRRTKLSHQRLRTVEQIFRVGDANRVDAVLCAGDLFDMERPAEQVWRPLAELLGRTQPRPIVLLPGNHDPLTPDSPYWPGHPFRAALPDHVHVVDHADYTLPLGPDATLYAVPTESRAGAEDAALRLPPREANDTQIRVGLVHGTTKHFGGATPDFPIAPDAGVQRGLNYLALGDLHNHQIVHGTDPNSGVGMAVYPGTPEPMRFGESAGGQVALVFLRRHGRPPRLRMQKVGQYDWRQVECDSLPALKALLADPVLAQMVLRLTLNMALTFEEHEELKRLLVDLTGTEVMPGRVAVLESLDRSGVDLVDGAFEDPLPDDVPDELRQVDRRLRTLLADPSQADVAEQALVHLRRLLTRRTP